MKHRLTALTAAALLAAAATTVNVATAQADAPDESGVVERTGTPQDYIFVGDGLVVMAGPPIGQMSCTTPPWLFPPKKSTVVSPPSGGSITTAHFVTDVWVYDDMGYGDDPLALVGVLCEAYFSGSPIAPLAAGEGRGHSVLRVDADGVESGNAGVTAMVTTTDGRRVPLSAHGPMNSLDDHVNYGG